MHKRLLLYGILCVISFGVTAQEDNPGFDPDAAVPQTSPFRMFLSKFSFNASLGYGDSFYKHDLSDVAIVRSDGELLLSSEQNPSVGGTFNAYRYWINDPQASSQQFSIDGQYVSSDSTSYRMIGRGANIPLTVSMHFTFLEKIRVGGGATFELHNIRRMGLKGANDTLGIYQSNYKFALLKRYFGYAGYKFWNYKGWDYVGELKIGAQKLGGKYENALVEKSIFWDLGVSLERGLSEYFRVTVKPSVEFRNYTVAFPGLEPGLKHRLITPYVNVGVSYNFAPLKRCPIKNCHTQVNHVHQGKEYRSRRHPFYKKQNPNYGENYKQLQIYKSRNRGKL